MPDNFITGTVETRPRIAGPITTRERIEGSIYTGPRISGPIRLYQVQRQTTPSIAANQYVNLTAVALRFAVGTTTTTNIAADDLLTLADDLAATGLNLLTAHDIRFSDDHQVSGGVIDGLECHLGSGVTLASDGTKRPGLEGTGPADWLIAGDGIDDDLSALSALFDLSSGKALILVCTAPAPGAGDWTLAAICEASPYTRVLSAEVRNFGGPRNIGSLVRGASTSLILDSGVASHATNRRLIIVSRNATTAGSLQVPDAAKVDGVTDAAASGALTLSLFSYFGGLSLSPTKFRAALVADAPPDPAQVAIIKAWAIAEHAVTL